MSQKLRIMTDEERNAEIAARKGADSGTAAYDTLVITGNGLKGNAWAGDTFDAVYKAWAEANPGKMNKAAFREWFIKNNGSAIINVEDCKGNLTTAPNVILGSTVKLPEGNEITELMWKWACPKPTPPMPQLPAEPPVAPPPAREMNIISPVDYASQDTPSQDGKIWPVGSSAHALETLARSGLNPAFTREYYRLANVAARYSEKGAGRSGQIGGHVNGNQAGDHLYEGDDLPFNLGESDQSNLDNDDSKRRHGAMGPKGVVGRAVGGPRVRVYVPGSTEIQEDGSYKRSDETNVQVAFGGNYAIAEGAFAVPIGNLANLPIGIAAGKASNQVALPAETRRWGISQSSATLAAVNFAGFHNAFRDQQARQTGVLETPDRIYAYMHCLNAEEAFVKAMESVDKATTQPEKQAAAEKALIAWRDFSDNAQTKIVDSKIGGRVDAIGKGTRAYFESIGVDVKEIDTNLKNQPHLQVVDMPQEQLESLQSYQSQKDKRYADIVPGKTNEAFAATEKYAFRIQNEFDRDRAQGKANIVPERDLQASTAKAWDAIASQPDSVKEIGRFVQTNSNAQIQIEQMLRDVHKNYKNYGFKNQKEADAVIRPFYTPDDIANKELAKLHQKEIERKGSTIPLFFVKDQPFPISQPQVFAPQIGRNIEKDPEAFVALMNRVTDPSLGVDKQGRSDGRRFGIGIMRSFGAEMLPAGSSEGQTPAGFAALIAPLSVADQALVRQTVLDITSYAQSGASGVSNKGINRTDTLLRGAQEEAKGIVGVTTDATRKQDELALSGKFDTLYNTGAFNSKPLAEAVKRGDNQAIFNELFLSEEALATGAASAAVKALGNNEALARDVISRALVEDPKVLNGPVDALRDMADSAVKNQYNPLANAIAKGQESGALYAESHKDEDLVNAVGEFAVFFTKMERRAQGDSHISNNDSALRFNALKGFLSTISDDKVATAKVLKMIGSVPEMRDALIRATPDALSYVDGLRHTNAGVTQKGNPLPGGTTDTDAEYNARYFAVDRDEKGKVTGGWFRDMFNSKTAHVNVEAIKADMLAATAQANGVAEVTQSMVASGVVNNTSLALNTNPVLVLGRVGDITAEKALATRLLAESVKAGKPLTAAQADTYAAEYLQAGLVTVSQTGEALMATVNSTSQNMINTLVAAGQLSAAAGMFYKIPWKPRDKDNPPELIPGEIGNCLPGTRPNPAVGGGYVGCAPIP